ncbi:MAG: alpha/beta hydrolase family esterase, partial [Flavobacteriales bacterium]
TGTAQNIMDYSEFNSIAEENGFAVCYPQGIEDSFGNTFFNVGYDFQNGETVDDVAYLQHLVEHLQGSYSLTEEDIFCTGLSNGGDFCYLLACEASETFKGVAPVAGMILQEIMNNCAPANEVSIFEIHGTQDNVTYFEGDPENNDDWGAYPSIPATIAFFEELYNLEEQNNENLPNIDPQDGSTVVADKFSNEDSCTQVWLYTIIGGGHDWPGAWGNMDISASEEVWSFFEQLCDNEVGIHHDELYEYDPNRTLIKIVDSMGREIIEQNNKVMFFWYSDGSVERKLIVE